MNKPFKRLLSRYPLDPCGKPTAHRRVLLGLTCLGLFCAALCLGALGLLYGSLYFVKARLVSYFQIPMLAFLNLLPVVLLVFLLYFLTNRAWLSFLLSSVLVMTASIANYYKVVFRGDVMVFEDLKLIGAAVGILDEYDIHPFELFQTGILACILGTVFLFLVCRGRLPRWRWRLGGAAVLIAASLASYALWYDDDELYDSFDNYTLFNEWRPTEDSASRGLLYPFLHSIEDLRRNKPSGYSKKNAQAMLGQYPEADIPDGQKVDVIAVMLESFSDLSVFDSIDFTADPYEALRPIWAESETGTLIVETIGGGTVNAERSFLTGYTSPHPTYRQATESFVRYFARQGYQVEGSHPGHDWFYSRQAVNENLGFSQYYFMENYFSQLTDAEYAMDDVLFPAIRALYDDRDADTPYFAFHVSYQNHSPYDTDRLTWGAEYVARGDLSNETYYTVNNYLAGVADTADRAASFIDGFRGADEPVVLVFFGDHKPALGAGNSGYAELGVNMNSGDLAQGFRNYYSAPYWIWMNDAAKAALDTDPAGEGPDLSPCFLMREVFDACGWTGSPYLQFLSEVRDGLPVVQSSGVYSTGGPFTTDISENSQILLEKLQQMQYYLRRNRYQ